MVSEEEYVSYVRQFSDTVLRIAVNYCKELPDAEDMVQEVFLKLYETGMDFTDDEHVKRWLIRVTDCRECRSGSSSIPLLIPSRFQRTFTTTCLNILV